MVIPPWMGACTDEASITGLKSYHQDVLRGGLVIHFPESLFFLNGVFIVD